MEMTEFRDQCRLLVEDPTLTFSQRRHRLAALAEGALDGPTVSDACAAALDKRIVCDMFEGPAPYRPRYVLPDYAKALANGSAFLELAPPTDLDEALAFLLIMYSQVPSITGYPVYLGDLDKLLTPFTDGPSGSPVVSDDELHRRLRLFWISIDRMFPDAFVHTDIGPDDSRVARTILRLERELKQVVPNLTMKVDPLRTPDSLVLDGVETVFACAQPHFVNHPMMVSDHGEGYASVSCYNSLKIGGGSHTLVRLNLKEVVLQHNGGLDAFFEDTLPHYVALTAELIEARVRYLVEDAGFFRHHWLANEGLIELSRFSAMFGIFGLAEAVDLLMEASGRTGTYGHDDEANALSYRITSAVAALVRQRPMPYCDGGGGACYLHSQSGIDSDVDVTAGTRIPAGREPNLYAHLRTVAPHHRLFASGISDVVHVDETAVRNPRAVVDIIRGAFVQGMRDFTFNLDGNEFIRITGYLVRKADLAHLDAGAATRHGSDALGLGAVPGAHLLDRVSQPIAPAGDGAPHQIAAAVRRVRSNEHEPSAAR